MGRRALLAATATLFAPAIRAQAQTAGVALVIGNSKYQWEAALPNVRRDAPDIAKRFQAIGLRTELVQDAGRDAMRQAIDKFASACRGANFAAFYFAGHGATWERGTHMVPVDADLSTPHIDQLVQTTYVNETMKDAVNRLRAWDNCRNNPADGWRQTAAERAAVITQDQADARYPNTLVLFSTAPGRVALDGPAGQNSPFAAAVLRQLGGQVDLQTLAPKLRRDLLIATRGRQVLFDRSSYQQPFMLGRGAAPAAAGHDPSKVVELPNAYAFAQANGLPLVPGLIAYRPAGNSPHATKIGSYKYEHVNRSVRDQQVLVIMSVEDSQAVQLIVSGKSERGPYWRFVTASFSGNTLEYIAREGGSQHHFDWTDANSGSLTQIAMRSGGGSRGGGTARTTSRFTRLDG